MSEAETSQRMSTGLTRVMEAARRNPQGKMRSLCHHIDVAALERSYHRIRKEAAVGVDGVSKEEYGLNIEVKLADLHGRLKGMKYRHQPIRRVHIPKSKGRTRPIGVSTERSSTHQKRERCKDRFCHRCSATSTCTTWSTFGTNAR